MCMSVCGWPHGKGDSSTEEHPENHSRNNEPNEPSEGGPTEAEMEAVSQDHFDHRKQPSKWD
jgi:hypothetical protein